MAPEQLSAEEHRALLQWYDAMGITTLIDDHAPDFSKLAQSTQHTVPPAVAPASFSAQMRKQSAKAPLATGELSPGNENVVDTARQLAGKCNSIAQLKDVVEGFEGCALKAMAKKTVFCDGNPDAPIMFIGEAPGRDEDLQGKPFVGRAGQLFDKMLAAIQLDRDKAYLTNIVYWRPPGKRSPSEAECAICRPFTDRQIALVKPKVLVMLGGAPAKELMATKSGILKTRGRWSEMTLGGHTVQAVATLHPAYLLCQPAQKRLAWADLQMIQAKLAEFAT